MQLGEFCCVEIFHHLRCPFRSWRIARAELIARLCGRRTRNAANSLDVEIEVDGFADRDETVRFDSSLDAYRIAISENRTLAVLSRQGEIYLADLSIGGAPVIEQYCVQPGTRELDFSIDSKFLVAIQEDEYVIWDVKTNQEISACWQTGGSRFLCFFHDSQTILEALTTGVQIRKLSTGEITNRIHQVSA